MTFEHAWEKHLNSEGSRTTMLTIKKYGIRCVKTMCSLAYHIGKNEAYQHDVETDAKCNCTEFGTNRCCPVHPDNEEIE